MYEQVFDPVSNSLGVSTIFAALPLISLFVLLGVFRVTAWLSGLISLAVAIAVAVIVYDVPFGQSLDMGAEGAAFGLFPIMWIVVNAIWIYNMTEFTGHFAVLRRSFATISDDQRIQAIIIAFAFGALIEGLAGFGTPVAITSVMLMALGFKPLKAAALSLIGNTAPVAFGSIATPIVTLASQTELPFDDLGAMVGRQTPFLALIVPLILVAVVDGKRGMRQTWPAALVAGVTFAIAQFVCSNYVSVELTDIIAALVSTIALVGFLRVWKPSQPLLTEPTGGPLPTIAGASGHDAALERSVRLRDQSADEDTTRQKLEAFAPYIIIVVVFALAEARRPDREVPVRVLGRNRLRRRGREDAERLRLAGAQRRRLERRGALGGDLRVLVLGHPGNDRAHLRSAHRRGAADQHPRRPARLREDAEAAGGRDCDRDGGPRPRLRDEPDRDDRDDRPLDRRRRRRVRLPLADHRLARGRDHRLGHVLERALRGSAGGGRKGSRALRRA